MWDQFETIGRQYRGRSPPPIFSIRTVYGSSFGDLSKMKSFAAQLLLSLRSRAPFLCTPRQHTTDLAPLPQPRARPPCPVRLGRLERECGLQYQFSPSCSKRSPLGFWRRCSSLWPARLTKQSRPDPSPGLSQCTSVTTLNTVSVNASSMAPAGTLSKRAAVDLSGHGETSLISDNTVSSLRSSTLSKQ